VLDDLVHELLAFAQSLKRRLAEVPVRPGEGVPIPNDGALPSSVAGNAVVDGLRRFLGGRLLLRSIFLSPGSEVHVLDGGGSWVLDDLVHELLAFAQSLKRRLAEVPVRPGEGVPIPNDGALPSSVAGNAVVDGLRRRHPLFGHATATPASGAANVSPEACDELGERRELCSARRTPCWVQFSLLCFLFHVSHTCQARSLAVRACWAGIRGSVARGAWGKGLQDSRRRCDHIVESREGMNQPSSWASSGLLLH